MSYKIIEKGTVIGYDWYYVVVAAVIRNNQLHLECICDNANNIYSFTLDSILNTKTPHKWLVVSPLKAIEIANWSGINSLTEEDQKLYHTIGREMPIDVIVEVLTGKHDDRFDH